MDLNAVPPELIGVLQSSTVSDEDKQAINDFFAKLDDSRRPDIMREVRSRGNWQDKIKYCLEQAKATAA
jgi:hypothetical protein